MSTMRLLQYAESDRSPSTYSFSLIKCNPRKPPPYAILSHRWGTDADEVTFRDIEQGTAETKAGGYKKLQFCAAQAARDDLRCFWVDTCCIDKTSSAELQEAINSMYNWYSNAAKCYVYLPDVSTEQEQEWEAAFQKSEWFKRGWTLQELIAPSIVEFFSLDGQKLGDKQSLQQQIHQITGISIEALQGKSLTEISEQERFSWTAGRQTTVDEDAVYCLLGIFGVHMPLLYSEGQQKAQTRLQREVQLQNRPELHTTVADWYSPADFADQQTDQLSRRQKGTGGWFLASDAYQRWRQQTNGTLLCPGVPGSGKSAMVANVVDDLQTYSQANQDVVVAYLYCNFNRQAEQDLRSILAALTRQLFQERVQLPETVSALYDKHRDRRTKPTVDELGTVFRSLVQSHSCVYIVIDALDECHNTDRQRDRLLSELFSLQQSKSNHVNILATTRVVPEIIQRFAGHSQIEIRADRSDLEIYLAARMTTLADFVSKDIKLQEEIKSCIVSAAEGMFLLARLQFDSLQDKTNRGRMRKAVAGLSKGGRALHGEYAKTIERIEQQREGHRDLARRVLLWITYAARQLSIDELREAVAIDPEEEILDLHDYMDDEDLIVSVCQGLVEVDRESRVIRLVHYTTQEYLETERGRWLPNGDLQIARSCLTYLSMDVFAHTQRDWKTDLTTIIQQHKFLEYAGKHWGTHAREAQHNDLQDDVVKFLSDDNYFRFSTMVTLGTFDYYGRKYKCRLSDISATHISAYFGLDQVTQDLIQQRSDLNCKDSRLQTPLHYAVERGHIETVKLLLTRPSIELNTKDNYGYTPLSLAVKEGHTEIVKLLLLAQPGVEVNAEALLSKATERGYTEIVKLLLAQPSIKLNTKDIHGDIPLSRAASKGHIEIIKLLLTQPGIEVNTKDKDGCTPLSLAAREGYTEIFKLLLAQPGIEVNTKDRWGCTPLSKAADRGHTEIFKLLLTQPGIEVNSKNEHGNILLLEAANEGYTEIFKLLLTQPGIFKFNVKDKYGYTSLSLAAREGHIEIVKLLLAQPGVDVNFRGPLSTATKRGRTEIVKLLLAQPGIKVNTEALLSEAVERGHTEIVKLLLA